MRGNGIYLRYKFRLCLILGHRSDRIYHRANQTGGLLHMKELDCLFIGSSTKDILMLVEAPPASDQRIAARQLEITCGGVSAIAGAAHQSLHGVTGVITALGDDDTSHFWHGRISPTPSCSPSPVRPPPPVSFRWRKTVSAVSAATAAALTG